MSHPSKGGVSQDEGGSTNHSQGEGVGGGADYGNVAAKWVHFYWLRERLSLMFWLTNLHLRYTPYNR